MNRTRLQAATKFDIFSPVGYKKTRAGSLDNSVVWVAQRQDAFVKLFEQSTY